MNHVFSDRSIFFYAMMMDLFYETRHYKQMFKNVNCQICQKLRLLITEERSKISFEIFFLIILKSQVFTFSHFYAVF